MQPLCLGKYDRRKNIFSCGETPWDGIIAYECPTRCPVCGLPVPSDAEQAFIRLLRQNGIREPDGYNSERGSEYHEGLFDFHWLVDGHLILVDIDGGTWQTVTDKRGVQRSGGHANPRRIDGDWRKRNGATVAGWRVLVFTSSMIENNPQIIIDMLEKILRY